MERISGGLIFFMILYYFSSCTEVVVPNNTSTGNSNLKDSTVLNIKYGNLSVQAYDLYLPAGRDQNTPIIFLIHGGGWKTGQKEDLNGYVSLIRNAWKNVAIVNLNYRLASNAGNIHHEEIIADVNAAVSHVLSNRGSYQISAKCGIMGASAGGQLAMIYAYKYDIQKNIKCVGDIFGPAIINDWAWYNSSNLWLGGYVGNVLTEYVGKSWDSTAYKAVSPYWNISSTSQPTIIFHGNLDPIVPLYQSQWLFGKLNSLSVPTQYYEYIAFHSFDDTQNIDVINKLIVFFKVYLK